MSKAKEDTTPGPEAEGTPAVETPEVTPAPVSEYDTLPKPSIGATGASSGLVEVPPENIPNVSELRDGGNDAAGALDAGGTADSEHGGGEQ